MPPATSSDFPVQIDKLRKQFGALVAVRDLSLSIPRGGVFGLLGPNGSGKTTTIGLLLGLIRPTSGSVRLFGEQMGPARPDLLQRIGAMVEAPVFYPDLSGRANLRFFQGISRRGRDPGEIDHLLELVGLAERANSRFRTYSLGMKQRLGIACALLGNPELVFLDEPTNGLDPAGMAEVRELIARLARDGRTVVLSSHLLNEVEQVCDSVAILSRGELVAQGKVRDLLQVQGSVRLKTTDNLRAEQVLGGLAWVVSLRSEAGYLVAGMATDQPGEITRALAVHQVYITEMVPLRVSLESWFLQVTSHEPGTEQH